MKRVIGVGLLLLGGLAIAQTVVNQGKPGTQGPWPVTISSGSGGSSGAVAVTESPCLSAQESVLVFDAGGASPCPITALAGRRSVTLCNSSKNSGSPVWTIRADGLQPTVFANAPGQGLGVGDCITYAMSATAVDGGLPLYCISDTGSSSLTITECK